jgi:hypothetical protein
MGRSAIDPSQSYEETRERARSGMFSPTTVSHRTPDIEYPTPPTIAAATMRGLRSPRSNQKGCGHVERELNGLGHEGLERVPPEGNRGTHDAADAETGEDRRSRSHASERSTRDHRSEDVERRRQRV